MNYGSDDFDIWKYGVGDYISQPIRTNRGSGKLPKPNISEIFDQQSPQDKEARALLQSISYGIIDSSYDFTKHSRKVLLLTELLVHELIISGMSDDVKEAAESCVNLKSLVGLSEVSKL